MTTFIVITTINAPTEACVRFSRRPEANLIVVGDKKTPENWHLENATYLSAVEQAASRWKLAPSLPWNHYSRKMLGYLHAIEQGAGFIIDTDDDNIPESDWSFPAFDGDFAEITSEQRFINIYRHFSAQRIWPRGFPLQDVLRSMNNEFTVSAPASARVGVWQGLADDDPDVDAIYRLTVGEMCKFEQKPPVTVAADRCVPFNSQNTAIRRELFPFLYLPAYVTFRFTDILRGLVAQPFMWKNNWALGFCSSLLRQERNAHDLLRDFESEIPCYLHPYQVLDLLAPVADQSGQDGAAYLQLAYTRLNEAGLVPDSELRPLAAWLDDLSVLI